MTLRENQTDEPVTSVMTKGILYINANKSIEEAVRILADFDIGSLIVTEKSKPVGIVTTKDIVRALSKNLDFKKTEVREIMQGPLISVSAHETISLALLKMKEKKINHLIVKDGEKVIGMLNPINLLSV